MPDWLPRQVEIKAGERDSWAKRNRRLVELDWSRSDRGRLGLGAHSLAYGRRRAHAFCGAVTQPCGSPHQKRPGH